MSSSDIVDTKKAKRQRRRRTTLIVVASILGVMLISSIVIGIISSVGAKALLTAASSIDEVVYSEERILPELDANGDKAKIDDLGNFTFFDEAGLLDERNFRVLQLTDIHIGAGAFSMRTDNWTLKTVEDLVRREQPDLVVVTGDIAYPVLFQAGTMNNKKEARIFASLMERLGVYWTLAFGNHDTEAYSYYDREDIGELYMSSEYRHCLFNNAKRKLSDGREVHGVGNFAINVLDKNRERVHTLYMVDSNAYLPEDPVGIQWKYDKIHDDQIDWYEETNDAIGGYAHSTMYFHIPSKDVVDAVNVWNEEGDNLYIEQRDGEMGEFVSGGTKVASDLYNVLVSHGTTGIFIGHDHKNNASYLLDKDGIGKGKLGLRLTYGMSIDYLAYPGIYKETDQRGGRMIEINSESKLALRGGTDIYDESHFEMDRLAGFYTYHVPYWKDHYMAGRID